MLRRAASASEAAIVCAGAGYRQWGACTESLGSESGDVGAAEDIDQQQPQQQLPAAGAGGEEDEEEEEEGAEAQDWLGKRRQAARPLPPAMPRAAGAFMRAERRGGRLILTEVVRPVQRPRGVLRASRADGRLRLRFAAAAGEDEEDPSCGGEEAVAPDQSNALVGGCCGGVAGFRQMAAAGAGRRVEIGAVMGI